MEPPTITVNEYDLLALPRRRAPGEKIIHECASATARWVLENSYRRLRPTTRDIRVEYDRQWLSHPGHQQLDPDSVAYAKLLLRGPRIAKRLSDLIDGFSVHVPVTPYELRVAGLTVTGEYAILHRVPRGRPEFHVLCLRTRLTRTAGQSLDVLAMARWLHAATTSSDEFLLGARHDSPLCIYNYAVENYSAARIARSPDISHCRQELAAAAAAYRDGLAH
jgi:hypothetical protein